MKTVCLTVTLVFLVYNDKIFILSRNIQDTCMPINLLMTTS